MIVYTLTKPIKTNKNENKMIMKYKFESYKESTDPVLFHVELNPDDVKNYNELQAKKQYVCDFIYDKERRLDFDEFAMRNKVPIICLFITNGRPDEFLDMILDKDNCCYNHEDLEEVYKTIKDYEAGIY